jgi:Sterol desaturase
MNIREHELENKQWNFHPKLPVGFYPIFDWPPSPTKLINFVLRYWLQKSDRTLLLLISFFTYFFLLPPLNEMSLIGIKWISEVALRNYILIFLVAGGLHWWFFIRKGQGNIFQYDTRNRNNKSKIFTFNNNIYDNMFWTLFFGVPIWIFFECLLLWSFASGKIEIFNFNDGWLWFCLWFPLLQIWQSFHFYCYHRVLHIPFFL